MRHGSLFSGIGGFDLAAHWLGWKNIFNVEIDPFCRKVLKAHFPFAEQFTDIRKFQGRRYYGSIDIISGGFPCQPFSLAGQRRGGEDDRYLWPEMLRVINEVRPTWVVGENVAGILSLVQPGVPVDLAIQTHFAEEGQEIITEHEFIVETICQDIERIGYSLQPFLIPACGAGAPHLRNRVWFIAHSQSAHDRRVAGTMGEQDTAKQKIIWPGIDRKAGSTVAECIDSNTDSQGLERAASKILPPTADGQSPRIDPLPTWSGWPAQSPVCRRDDGVSQSLGNISFSTWRKESIRAFGNAIVPQVAFQIFLHIQEIEASFNGSQ